MPAGFVPDPSSPQAEAAWRESVEQRLRQGKNNSQVMAPIIQLNTASQLGLTSAGWTAITGCSVTLVLSTRRILRISGFAIVQKHTTKAAIQLRTRVDGATTIGFGVHSVDGTTDDYATMPCPGRHSKPTEGTHVYTLEATCGSGTFDILVGEAFLYVEDAGLGAP